MFELRTSRKQVFEAKVKSKQQQTRTIGVELLKMPMSYKSKNLNKVLRPYKRPRKRHQNFPRKLYKTNLLSNYKPVVENENKKHSELNLPSLILDQ